ncbi:tetratricopeptide repeat protein [Solwaraspora sp. WMMD791]|uniref:CHAT domain-containing tetratricopeptide repeat protein n=1 Tax=Solwaraspora sp. WMMD791 TaxID=3016086 RepID=UPI00249C3C28|nr:tetratricopeptide repeat protein [Solwaraspora sp. WMMD791]WFE30777.1 tetratricopeptide repeat protein [Solwaraspora sp. WMMD791]
MRAARLVEEYGRTLFGQVFTGEAAYGYRRLRDRGLEGCRLVVQGSAALHRLHWETVRDPDGGRPLALRIPLVRRVASTPLRYEPANPAPTVNVLVVTARPFGPRDVGYRTISQPLVEAISRGRMPVRVDLVRPGTWEALRDALRVASREHGHGWYQVVHFDVHGGFDTAAAVAGASAPPAGGYLFDPSAQPGDGRQGFVFFETGTVGQARPVPSTEVAQLLAEHRVAVAVLNACQSAMQSGSEASLAQDLVAAGAPLAVGMAYSVTVSAAARAMPVFYERLAAGDDPVTAAWVARQALHDVKARRAYFEQDLELEDWILPVVFGQRPAGLRLREMTAAEQEDFYRRQAQVSAAPAVEYGFVGRDLDIHALERALLLPDRPNQVLVRGMAGAGKSTLLAHAGWWWQRTGLVDQVFAFSYEHQAWTADQIARYIAQQLFDRVQFAQWDSQSATAKVGQVTTLLRGHRHLIILDNAESITASPAAIPHALPEAERQHLARLLAALRGGRSLVLVGSREAETWLAASAFGGNVYELPGLDPQAASDLLERILNRHGGGHYLTDSADPQQREAVKELSTLLGGFPLPMTVVFPQLANTPPTQILAELRAGGEGADPTSAARRAIEYSHGKLDPALQTSMRLLAPFTASIPTPFLNVYAEALAEQEAVRAAGDIDLPAAVAELSRVGLAGEHPLLGGGWLQVVPILPYFLRNRLRGDPAIENAADQAHYRLYGQLAHELWQMLDGKEPQQRITGRAIVQSEYANLSAALAHGQRTAQTVLTVIRALDEYLDQTQQHDARRRLLDDAIARHPATITTDQKWELINLHNLAGHTALMQRRFDDAENHYAAELRMKKSLGRRKTEAVTYHQLGMIAQEQRRYDEAEQHYRQALNIHLAHNNQHSAAITYHQLGIIAQERRQFDQAEQHYRQSLDIHLAHNNQHSAASTYHQLGIIAQERQRYDQAEQYYQQSLTIELEHNNQLGAALTQGQLGNVALEQRRYDQAEQHYRQALNIFLTHNNKHSAATTYHQLGIIAQEQRRYDQAEQYYQQSLDIKLTHNNQHGAAPTYRQLGLLFGVLERHRESVEALLKAAVSWHASTGVWATNTLDEIRQGRARLASGEFERLVAAIVPEEMRAELVSLLDQPGQE